MRSDQILDMLGTRFHNVLSIGRAVDEKTQKRQVGVEPMSCSRGRQGEELEEAGTAMLPTEAVRLIRLQAC